MNINLSLARQAPLKAGFFMPAETDPHQCCWMAWPDRADMWGANLHATQLAYASVAKAIREFEPVRMVANPASLDRARNLCGAEIEIVPIPIDDAWLRDSGPTFLKHRDGATAGVAWRFNAWGEKSPHYALDAKLGSELLSQMGAPVYRSELCVEGGGIHSDGDGTIVTTESVVLNRNRNPGVTKADAERELCRALGARKVVWLPGDPDKVTTDVTDGHIDGLLSYVKPGVVIFESDPSAEGAFADLNRQNLRALELSRDARGRQFEIIHLEDAHEVETEHKVFCRSYVNFYVANGGIVMPKYGIAADDRARDVVRRAYPDRQVAQVDVNSIAPGGGGIHCITQQQPA